MEEGDSGQKSANVIYDSDFSGIHKIYMRPLKSPQPTAGLCLILMPRLLDEGRHKIWGITTTGDGSAEKPVRLPGERRSPQRLAKNELSDFSVL